MRTKKKENRQFIKAIFFRGRLFQRPAGGVFLVLILLGCSSWGFLVHRTVNQLAIYQLPAPMRAFFWKNKDSLVRGSVRPDIRRNALPAEEPRHFIDLEAYGDSAAWKMPLHKEDAIRIYTWDTLKKYGIVPYVVVEVKEQLTHAMRMRDRDSIVYYATELGHYIGDAHVPLHVSINYDGQLTGQKGLHSLWESTVPDLELEHYLLHDRHKARYLPDPAFSIWSVIRHTQSLLSDVFNKEKEISGQFADSAKFHIETRYGKQTRVYTPAFAIAYGAALGETINEQLLGSAGTISDFWYTAWVDAGKPDLNSLLNAPLEKKEQKACKAEFKDYRKCKLIEKKLLIARTVKLQ
ncbi:zinc dependent phospholipase C family protein [Flavitalea flava]